MTDSNKIVTASMLYNLVQCPHRVFLDEHEDESKRDPVDEFVQLLWDRGNAYEREVVAGLDEEFVDLTKYHGDEREAKTREAMETEVPLIYSARLSHGNMLGEPDLLRKETNGYIAGDIKSGIGYEGDIDDGEGKPKKHYAVQLSLYTDLLHSIGKNIPGRHAFVWDGRGDIVEYELDNAQGAKTPETWWQLYKRVKAEALTIVEKTSHTLPALTSDCGLCHWKTHCRKIIEAKSDISLVPELGRSRRDTLAQEFKTVSELAECNPEDYRTKKDSTIFPRIGVKTLKKFQERAQLRVDPNPKPYFKSQIAFPNTNRELFFDIESDPMAGVCYLHGFVVRENGNINNEKFQSFMMNDNSQEEEERVFFEAFEFIKKSQPCAIYIYSKYERTVWKQLADRYPSVASVSEVEDLYADANMIDLYYDVVYRHMVWPTHNHSIKTLAQYCKFSWRDDHPSGAASIKWYQDLCRTGDESIKQRILDYNEDDCRAMRVVLDYIKEL